jgi:tetratricopeptide (TPR) repeat protein
MNKTPSASNAPPQTTWSGQGLWLALLLAGLTWALYFPVTGHDFINFDDPEYVTKDPHVPQGLTLANVRWAFGTWHPLTWLSLMLDVNLFGTGPRGFHLMNLLGHTANSVLVFLVLRRMTGALWRSALVAALFAWHPVQVESVAWVAERKGVLSTFFGLLALGAYARYAEKSKVQSPKSKVWYASALVFFTLGLLSKPMLVTLPGLLLLLDYWPLRRFTIYDWRFTLGRLLREKLPFFALSALAAMATSLFQKEAGALQTLGGYSFASRIENVFIGYAHYLGKTFWPTALVTPYPRVFHWPLALVALAALLLAGLCVLALWFGRRKPFLVTGWFWFFGTLLPVIGILQVGAAAVADRYVYLPALGLFVIVVWGAGEFLNGGKLPKWTPVIVAVPVLAACAARTHDQLRYWQNSGTLFEHAVAVSRDNWIAHQCLGVYYDGLGRSEEAFQNFKRTTEIKPNYVEAWNSLGVAWSERKNFAEAAACFETALHLSPQFTLFRYNFARSLGILGRAEEAMAQYREVLKQRPDLATAENDLGLLLAKTGKPDEAIIHLEATLRLQPNNPLAHYYLGRILAKGGRSAEAIEHWKAALRLRPDFAPAREALRTAGISD